MVTGFRPTPAGGGSEKHVFELARGLIGRGVEVDVICEDASFLPDDVNPLADRIIGVPSSRLKAKGWVERYREKSAALAELIDPGRYDLVHCHSHYGFHAALRLSARALRPRLVSTFHLTPLGSLRRFEQLGIKLPEGAPIDRAVALMEEAAAILSDRCIAVSRGVAREIRDFYGVPASHIDVIHNWYDPAVFYPRPRAVARRALGLDPSGTYVLYVGHFGEHRGWMMRDVLRLLPPHVRLLVVHADEEPDIAAEFGERVVFTGHASPGKMGVIFSAADLQAFTTVYGGFGLVLVEGMACGCPPVAFDYSAMDETVTAESGYLVSDPTPEAFARGVLAALAEGDAKREGAIHRAKSFDMNRQIDATLAVYRSLTMSRRLDPSVRPARPGSSRAAS